ncbi:hypothetical protein ACXR0O_07565 [Verrucomicrobiota bacterium sgz303538]
MTPFERKLQSRPFREIPAGWRAQILQQPPPAQSLERSGWCEWLWPSPIAWAALAAIWIGVFALGKMAPVSAPPTTHSAELASQSGNPLPLLAERERLLVQLIENSSLLRQ